jgi:hypothetical protein
MWKLNKAIAKEYLPDQPRDFEVQPWWHVSVVNLSLEEYRVCSLVCLNSLCNSISSSVKGLVSSLVAARGLPLLPVSISVSFFIQDSGSIGSVDMGSTVQSHPQAYKASTWVFELTALCDVFH